MLTSRIVDIHFVDNSQQNPEEEQMISRSRRQPATERLINQPTKLESFINANSLESNLQYADSSGYSIEDNAEIDSKKIQETFNHTFHLNGENIDSIEETVPADNEAEKEHQEAEKVEETVTKIQTAVNHEDAVEGATRLRVELAKLPPEQRAEILKKLKENGTLEHLVRKTTDLDAKETAVAVKELAHVANLAGPENARLLTDVVAKVMADGGMEQVGESADGWGGMFPGANKHNSEREFVEGVAALGDSPEAELFRTSLTASLDSEAKNSTGVRADRAGAMASAVATGDSKLIPDDGAWSRARNFGKDVADKVSGF
jgi:hypothetical protein